MMRVSLLAAIAVVLVLWSSTATAQAVFVGIPGSRCESSTAVADAKAPDWVEDKKYWASGFLDGAHAALGMGTVRSSVNFTYARLQNYCGQHPNATLQDAMLALVAEDRLANSATNTPATSGPPQAVYRMPVFRLDPPTWVLWTNSDKTEWEIVTGDAVNISSANLSYFGTLADCTTVRLWLAGLPKDPAVSSLNIGFQCFPSNFDPRGKK